MSFDILPDDVLVEIFDFHVIVRVHLKEDIEAWQSLVHVCQRWRRLVFGSPRRLDLQLFCATETQTRMRDTLDIWPALPLVVQGSANPNELDNIIAVLERSDRVSGIDIYIPGSHSEDIWTAMQVPFPELTSLSLSSSGKVTIVPDSILGGSASRLQELSLDNILFPGLPKLLLSATHLVHLQLTTIPHPEYFSLDTVVTVLSTLTSLDMFWLQFQSPLSLPSRRPPPLTRSVLPALSSLRFKGASEYLEDLVAHIDTPRLLALYITLFNQIVFDTPHTIQFISRAPALRTFEEAHLTFEGDTANVRFLSPTIGYDRIHLKILCREFDWQVSSLEQVCTSSLPLLSVLEDLYIYEEAYSEPDWKDNIEDMLWLELLQPFTAMKNLYLSEKFVLRIAPALQELIGGRKIEVMPALENIFLEGLQPSGPGQEGIVKFVAARQLSGHPITVSIWERATFRLRRGMLS